jgi:hypothetical protein
LFRATFANVIRLPLFEIASVLVCLNHAASFIVNTDDGVVRPVARLCELIALLTAFGSAYHSRPNGSASLMRSTPRLSLRWSNFVNVLSAASLG